MTEQLELANQLKHDGQDRVLEHQEIGWKDQVMLCVQAVARELATFTSDNVRDCAETCGVFAPTHHNAWGSVMTGAAKAGMIRKTGRFVVSRRASAHARIIAEWEAMP